MTNPHLRLLRQELDAISNPHASLYNPFMRLHDWYYTRLYQEVYDCGETEFNRNLDDWLFCSEAEIEAFLPDLIQDMDSVLMVKLFCKAVNSIR